jgi:abhydrolase domain-containing protein 6
MIVGMVWLTFALLGGVIALYFLAPGVAFSAAMALGRKRGGLKLKQTQVDGHRIPYLEGGDGEALVLLHGFGANKDNWTLIAPYLTRQYHVYAPDLPGFGDSSRLEDASYGVDAQLARLRAFADAVGLESFHLGGNSMGGYLAAMFGARESERVKSLWLLAPAGATGAQPSEVLSQIENGQNPLITETLADFERLAELCFTVTPQMPAQFKRPLLARARREAPFNRKIFQEIFSQMPALEGSIDGLQTPSLVVWGDNDRVLHCSGLDIIKGLLSNAESVLMPRMGHVPMIERPAETAADYLRFRGTIA